MPKQIYKLRDFSGGLNFRRDPRDIADNELVQADFCYIDRIGGVRPSGEMNPGGGSIPPEGTHTAGAGYYAYETDHVAGSSAATTGARWLATVDGLDGTFESTAIVGTSYTAATTGVDLGSVDAPTWTAGQLSFGGSIITRLAGSYFDDENLESGDFIQISGATTDVKRNCYAYASSVGATRIQFEGFGPFAGGGTPTEGSTVTIKRLIRPVFFDSADDVRIADASMSSSTKRKKYSYIKNIHFEDAGTAKDTYDDWYANDCTLTPPTELHSASSGYPSAGAGFHLNITTPATTADVIGEYPAKTFQIAASYIYENNQESKLYIPTSNHEFTTASGDYVDIDVNASPAYDERIYGARIYARPSGTNEPWVLLVDISMKDGCRTKLEDEYSPWVRDGADNQVGVDTLISTSENLETYTILNGFSPDEFSIELASNGEGYKDAIIANRRAFICNVSMIDEYGDGTETVRMRDRIMYSPINKFDTFPRSFFIDVVQGDADEYTALATYADRLFAYKANTLYIINIASPSPSNWFLESTERDLGVNFPCSVWTGKKGIYWANINGAYWYNGSSIVDLTEKAMPTDSALTGQRFTVGSMPLVVYIPDIDSLFVKQKAYSLSDQGGTITLDNGGTWVYNFGAGGWTRIRYDSNSGDETDEFYSNFVKSGSRFYLGAITQNTGDGSLDTASDQGTIDSDLISSDSFSASKQVLKTKDLDFGEPARIKKIYAVTITYKSNYAMTTPVSYSVDGADSFSNFTGNFVDTSGDWANLRATVASPFECQSLQIKVENTVGGGTGSFHINDISIEYRPIYKRAS